MNHYCPDCHKEMEMIRQPKWNGGVIELVTCRSPRCDLNGVTLTPEQLAGLTDDQLEAYRIMVRNRRVLED